MKLNEYLDPARFPSTMQRGLTPKQQLMIDAYNYDQLREFLDSGGKLSEKQQRIWKELQPDKGLMSRSRPLWAAMSTTAPPPAFPSGSAGNDKSHINHRRNRHRCDSGA